MVHDMKTTWTSEVRPSARGLTLEWWSKGPEYCAFVFMGGVIQGSGFAASEGEALANAKNDALVRYGLTYTEVQP